MSWFAGVRRLLLKPAAALAALAFAATGAPALAQPAFWAVKDADSTIYLLGTIHLLKPDMEWRTEKLDAALAESTALWLELPTTNAAAMQSEMMILVSRYGLSPADRLSRKLTKDEIKTLDEAARLAGLSASQLDVFRPWFAALTISTAAMTRAGYDPASGVDSKIEGIFRQRNITPKGLETAEEQIKVFASMTSDQELRYLRETMEEYQDAPTELDDMVKQWASADLTGMEELFVTEMKDEEPDLYAALLVNRNANWVPQIEQMLQGSGTTFIAVGAGHLIGPDSVIAMLAAKGIVAERVQ
ncbi:MAG: TraB/GumN family protein [Alphaproteobacteria bacterium]|nr:MAG: TraB/GumN family protein [Alphaproteobacteria bacterium]